MPVDHVEQPDLLSDAHDVGYRPSIFDSWSDPDPVSVGQALDRLAAIASVAASGATLPTSPAPVQGQWFLHTPTGRTILYQYDGSNWFPIISFGSMTVYVDKTDGTDSLDKGTGVDSAAFKTLQYAVNAIPGLVGGNVTININVERYSEEVIIRGKNLTGDFTITLQGVMVLTVIERNVTAATTNTVTIDGGALTVNAHVGQLVRLTNGTGSGQEAIVLSNTATVLTIVGHWDYTYPNHEVGGSSTPDATTDLVIENWITSVSRILLDTGQKGIVLRWIKVDTPSNNDGTVFIKDASSVQILGCKVTCGVTWSRAVQVKNNSSCILGSSLLFQGKNGTLTVLGGSTFSCGCVWIDKGNIVGSGCLVQGATGAFLASRIDDLRSGSNTHGLFVERNGYVFLGWKASNGSILTGAAGGASDLLCHLGGGCASATDPDNTIATKTIVAATYGWET